MHMKHWNQFYCDFLAGFGIALQMNTICASESPATLVEESEHGFVICINPEKLNHSLPYEAHLAYRVSQILLPRLELETDRLLLRRYRAEDAADCFAFLSDASGAAMDCCKPFESMDEGFYQQLELFAQRERQYMIVLKSTGTVIGTINVFDDNSRAVDAMELGYCIAPAYQRQGYACEALSALISLLQEKLLIPLLSAGVLPENRASIGLLEKLGFQPEGLRHKAVWHEGLDKPVDLQYYYLDRM